MDLIKKIISQSKNLNKIFVFPEGEDERILNAVSIAVRNKIIKAILLGDEKIIKAKAKKKESNRKYREKKKQ